MKSRTSSTFDVVVLGAGIIGLCVAREILRRDPSAKIAVIDKEKGPLLHASGRNSGVLHAGFYYRENSLKARFVKEGNRAWKEYCRDHGLRVVECGKLVLARSSEEMEGLEELMKRGRANGVELSWVEPEEILKLEPLANAQWRGLYSPTTAVVDPKEIGLSVYNELRSAGVVFNFNERFLGRDGTAAILTTSQRFEFSHLYNCTGLYAEKVSQVFGFGTRYQMAPFRGAYAKISGSDLKFKRHLYPVPPSELPFLGVHFTRTMQSEFKIGPTAFPALWREHYSGFAGFSLAEFLETIHLYLRFFVRDTSGFRSHALHELLKRWPKYLLREAKTLLSVGQLNEPVKLKAMPSGIRAQLVDIQKLEFVNDFILEGDAHSTHVLNAVSPAFTCALPFAAEIVNYRTKS